MSTETPYLPPDVIAAGQPRGGSPAYPLPNYNAPPPGPDMSVPIPPPVPGSSPGMISPVGPETVAMPGPGTPGQGAIESMRQTMTMRQALQHMAMNVLSAGQNTSDIGLQFNSGGMTQLGGVPAPMSPSAPPAGMNLPGSPLDYDTAREGRGMNAPGSPPPPGLGMRTL